jgi:hypothetical protein
MHLTRSPRALESATVRCNPNPISGARILGFSLVLLSACAASPASAPGDASSHDGSDAISYDQGPAPPSPIEGRPCTSNSDCQTDTPCGVGICELSKCRLEAGPDGSACDDHDVCSLNDACRSGSCVGDVMPCADGNTCTLDACDAKTGCVHAPTIQACSEGDPCTAYKCEDGACVAGGSACDDGNPCTQEDCSATLGCHSIALSGPACDDGNPCTLEDKCTFGACKGGGLCDDSNPCTIDSCDGAGGCKHLNVPLVCTDGDVCTNFDVCVDGTCKGTVKTCDDGNPCTVDTCNPLNSACNNVPIIDGGDCDDGNPCTFETKCVNSLCAGQTVDCGDGDPCTDDKCVFPSGDCLHTPSFKCGK